MSTTRSKNLVCALFALCVITANLAGATPFNYKLRIDGVRPSVDELISGLDTADAEYERRTVESILKAIPQTEKIEWQGGSIVTENQWLTTAFNEFAAETEVIRKEAILNSISERLSAISISVGELDRAIKAESTKDADKQKLAEILSRQEYQKPEAKEESFFQKWWREFWNWIKSLFPEPNITPTAGPNLAPIKLVLQVLVFAAAIGLVGFLLWRFVPYLSVRLRSRVKQEKFDRVILGETIGDDESATDIFDEAELLARQGDLRGAIRRGYIAILCELGDRKVIRLARHKTNRDYLRDVSRRERIYYGMSRLTSNFEQNWYGLRETEPSDWEDFRAGYHATVAEAKGRG